MTTAPDLSTYRAVHTALRRAPHRLAESARTLDPADRRRVKAFARYWRGYEGEVVAHHTIEDDSFFPALIERVPVAAELIERTDADHERLDELMEACSASIARIEGGAGASELTTLIAALRGLADHMDQHLGFEDADILPLFERHFTGDEYAALEEQAQKSLGIGAQAAFTVPFVAAALAPPERERIMAAAPTPFRVLYRLTRGRHARLETRVFHVRSTAVKHAPGSKREVAA
jgi:hemerythrin-like domain-containing protein